MTACRNCVNSRTPVQWETQKDMFATTCNLGNETTIVFMIGLTSIKEECPDFKKDV